MQLEAVSLLKSLDTVTDAWLKKQGQTGVDVKVGLGLANEKEGLHSNVSIVLNK